MKFRSVPFLASVTPVVGGSAVYINQTIAEGTNTVTGTLPAGVTATDTVFAFLLPGQHGLDSTAVATLAAPSGWTAEDSATVETLGTRLFSAPGNVASLTFTATGLRSVLIIGVTGTRRASAMACRYWGSGEGLHTTPSVVAGAGDLVIGVQVQNDGAAPTFGTPTTDYTAVYTKIDVAPYVRVVTRTGAPSGATGEISVSGGTNFSTRTVLTLAIQA